MVLYTDLTFYLDEWSFLLDRRGFNADAFLQPHNEHIVILPVAVFKLLQVTFGMDSARPFQVFATVAFLTSVAMLYVLLRRFVDEWLALAGTLPLLFLGGGFEVLLLPFQLAYSLAFCFGIGALLVLQRGADRDLLASLLLTLSVASTTIGLPFVIGVAAWLAIDPVRRRRWRILIAPIGLFAVWWLGWGHTAANALSFENLATAPAFILDGFAASLSNLLGLATPRDETTISPYDWGRPLLVALVLVGAIRLWRLRRVPEWFVPAATLGVAFWALVAFSASLPRTPTNSRYQVIGAMAILLLAAVLIQGTRPRRPWSGVILAVAVLATVSNISFLHHAWETLVPPERNVRAALAAVEISRDTVAPDFLLDSENGGAQYFAIIDAGSYLSAVDAFGSPAYDQAELLAAPEAARETADLALFAALRLELAPLEPAASVSGRECRRATLSETPVTADLPPDGVTLSASPDADVDVRLRRYATDSFPVDAGELSGGDAVELEIPADASSVPWELALVGSGGVTVCALG